MDHGMKPMARSQIVHPQYPKQAIAYQVLDDCRQPVSQCMLSAAWTKYSAVHLGRYWALVNQEIDHCRSQWVIQWQDSDEGVHHIIPTILTISYFVQPQHGQWRVCITANNNELFDPQDLALSPPTLSLPTSATYTCNRSP